MKNVATKCEDRNFIIKGRKRAGVMKHLVPQGKKLCIIYVRDNGRRGVHYQRLMDFAEASLRVVAV